MEEKQRPDLYYIPENFSDGKTFKGVAYRNIVEALAVSYGMYKLIFLTPFIFSIKAVATMILAGGFGIFFLIGIKGESVTQFMYSYLLFKQRRRKLHLRRTGYVTKKERMRNAKEKKSIINKIVGAIEKARTKADKFIRGEETGESGM